MENRKGSTLIIILLVFVVLIIFGTSILSFMVNENKQSLYHQYKTQAYYIARSGAVAVEAAIMEMDENERAKLIDSIPVYVEISPLSFDNSSLKTVLIKKVNNNIVIESKGKTNGVNQIIEKILEVEEVSGGGSEIEINTAVHSEGEITLNSGKIKGDVTSNQGPIMKVEWQGFIEGAEEILISPKQYSLPIFPIKDESLPQFTNFPIYNPSVNKSDDLNFGWPTEEITIDSHKYYKKLEIPNSKKLIIDAQKSNINIWVDTINLGGNITIIGNNQVTIYIKESFKINSSLPISKTNTSSSMDIYFSGSNISINGVNAGVIPSNIYLNPSNSSKPNIQFSNSRVKGDLYIYRGDFSITGNDNVGIDGNIYSKVDNINIPNGKIIGNVFAIEGNITSFGSAFIDGDMYSGNGDVL